MGIVRLDKFLSEMGIGTRSQIKELVKKGRVQINEKIVTKYDTKIDPSADVIAVDHVPVSYSEFEYIMFYKPAGCVTAVKDNYDKTVMDYIKTSIRNDLSPVGRLDKDTEGLLLLTNDGKLSHFLLSPKRHVDKTYYAKISGIVSEQDCKDFASGLDIGDDKPALPANLTILATHDSGDSSKNPADTSWSEITVTICEGRFHQVKRMFQAVNKEVLYLKRLTMGPISLDQNLTPGQYRHLTEDEIQLLREHIPH